ncbi:MAG: hypothetical protein ABFD89_05195 [Bryobacteraceae bacterium]
MNCGLSNLDRLKAHLLPAGTMAGERKFDEVIKDLGLGVAEDMENYCNRKFVRAVGDTAIFQADRNSFVLPRYPVEEVTLVELDARDGNGFVAQSADFVQSVSLPSGVVYLSGNPDAGKFWAQVRFTYTGGYWFEQLEPEDAGYPTAQPAGAVALPNGLRLAWLNHCRAMWNAWDKLGVGLVDAPNAQTTIGEMEFSPAVKRALANYQMMQPV